MKPLIKIFSQLIGQLDEKEYDHLKILEDIEIQMEKQQMVLMISIWRLNF